MWFATNWQGHVISFTYYISLDVFTTAIAHQ